MAEILNGEVLKSYCLHLHREITTRNFLCWISCLDSVVIWDIRCASRMVKTPNVIVKHVWNLAGPSLSLDGILLQVGRIVKVPSKMTLFFVCAIHQRNESKYKHLNISRPQHKGQLGVYTPNSVPTVFNLLCFYGLLGIITHKYSCNIGLM